MMWAGMGLDALAIRSIEPRVRLEKFFAVPEYAASTIWNASQWRGIRLRLWADDQELEGHYLMAVANNIRRYMGGHSILSPDAYIDDGLLDLWLFQGDSLADAFRIAYELWRGHHVNSSEAQRIPFQSLRVQAESPFFVHMDAEPKDATQEAQYHRPQAGAETADAARFPSPFTECKLIYEPKRPVIFFQYSGPVRGTRHCWMSHPDHAGLYRMDKTGSCPGIWVCSR